MESVYLKNNSDDFFLQEAYRVLRTNLRFCGEEVKVIAITSTGEGEGKSMISLNIAKSFAELGKRVLLLDADMRRSVMAERYTNADGADGLSEVLSGLRTASDCIYSCQTPRLHLMFAGRYPPNPAELLSGKRFADLLSEVRHQYDYVIVDTPSLGRVIDAAVIAPHCDGTALVVCGRKTTYHAAQQALNQLKKSGCRVLGAIWNSVPAKPGKKRKRH
ncbi:MAG: CpsD/CapB family tyrosine-protein kinase [Clostridia bacterium]|nr:CpsD/CapB family tyrosine-protein kinase [Clostridia bacterium]